MLKEVLPLAISAVAALTAIATAVFTWWKFYYDKKTWVIDLKKSYSMEIYKARLETYPILLKHLMQLSATTFDPHHIDAAEIVSAINEWLYGKGGLVAERQLRNCVVHLRDVLRRESPSNEDIAHWKHMTTFFLRYDLDIFGLEDSTSNFETGLLAELKQRVEQLLISSEKKPTAVGRYGDPDWAPNRRRG